MKSYRMSLNTDEEKMEAISLFESLGYVVNRSNMKIWCNLQVIENGFGAFFVEERQKGDLITMQQLKDIVVLHRNDVSDATHKGQLIAKYYVTENGETYNFNGLKWIKKDVPARFLTPITVEQFEDKMGLISGAEALRAIADGEDVEVYMEIPNKLPKTKGWVDASVCSLVPFAFISPNLSFKFRLKPKTVKLEIEVPAPFEPKNGEHYWYINPHSENGYSWGRFCDGACRIQFGAWRTEAEIKVVAKQMKRMGVLP